MSDDTDQTVNGSGNGLAEGLGAANTQQASPMNETSAAEAGLPFGTGSQTNKNGRPVPHPFAPKPPEHRLGSNEPDHKDR